jgi:glutamine synthetase
MNPRFKSLEIIQTRDLVEPIKGRKNPSEIFAANVFTEKVMKHYLSKEVYLKLKENMEQGETIARDISGPVANAMKTWAMDKGVTHFTHWFQPLTGLTAEKHDSFFELSHGEPIQKFSGDELSQQEPDASSFPSGGLRNTFEARGYTAWDPTSPAFIFESRYGNTLCIPTVFVSYTGEALDFKAPLLKSIHLLEEAAVAVCQYFDKNVRKVTPTLGPEQEYFLIDRTFFDLRPDLILTGRTVFGAAPARGQQLDDHYFGSIPERAFAFMNELEEEAHKLGIPLKTRHNEVAPSQFECAPQFQELNVAVDHAQLLMDVIDRVARKHHLRALLHEKPFSRINGSGKHNNWSMATDTGKNLLSPGTNPKDNLMFLTFFVTVIKAVYEYADLLRASIASAGNDHRLGANEAPPAIISVFVGTQLSKILDEIEAPPRKRRNSTSNPYMKLGIRKIPEILLDNTDRNRTSPFAFTGNKFEFRAVGSSANSANPMMVLNVIVAEQLKDLSKRVDRKIARGRKKEAAILDVLKDYIKTSKAIRFEGDGYSQDWVEEAEKRGLSNVKLTPKALDFFLTEKATKLFTSNGIFRAHELHARHEVLVEHYLNKVKIESQVIENLALNHVVPPAVEYQKDLIDSIQAGKAAGLQDIIFTAQLELVKEIGEHVSGVISGISKLKKARIAAEKGKDTREVAIYFGEKVLPIFDEIREHVDELENIVPDQTWTLPKYREMLFVR